MQENSVNVLDFDLGISSMPGKSVCHLTTGGGANPKNLFPIYIYAVWRYKIDPGIACITGVDLSSKNY